MKENAKVVTLKIIPDGSPVLLFIELLQCALHFCRPPIKLDEITSDFVRIESNFTPAPVSELRVTLYPSDRFLRHAAAVFAGKLDLDAIKDIGHE